MKLPETSTSAPRTGGGANGARPPFEGQTSTRRGFLGILSKGAGVILAGRAAAGCAVEEGHEPESLFGGPISNQVVEAEAVDIPCGKELSVTTSPNFSTQTEWFVSGSDELAGSETVPAFTHLRLNVPNGCPLVVRMESEHDTEVIFSFEGLMIVNNLLYEGSYTANLIKKTKASFVFRNPTAEEIAIFTEAEADPDPANPAEPQS